MNWEQVSPYCQLNVVGIEPYTAGRPSKPIYGDFSICRVMCDGQVIYELWRKIEKEWQMLSILGPITVDNTEERARMVRTLKDTAESLP